MQIAEQMADFLLTGAVSNAVNMPSLTAEEAARLRPYMMLAEQLGSFAGQLTETGIRAVAIEYEGAVAELNVKPLTATALTGLLAPQLAAVNMVNAPVICRAARHPGQRDAPCRAGDYQNLIRVTVTTERRQRSSRRHRLRRQQAAHVSMSRASRSKPSSAGTCCSCAITTSRALSARSARRLGAAEVNIATFHLGRTAPGQDAIALVEVDQPLTPALIDTVRRLPNVIQAKAMRF